jgi:hypothetical protein
VSQTGLGFTLIRREVFERIRTPWFQFGAASGGRVIGEDTWFSNGVTQAGFEILWVQPLQGRHRPVEARALVMDAGKYAEGQPADAFT